MLRFYNLFVMRRIVTTGHAPENFIVSHNKSDTIVELFDRRHSNYISTITSQPRGFSSERKPDANFISCVCYPEARWTLRA